MSGSDNQEPGSSPTMNVSENELERFLRCPVCLDLAYKPVVHSCGHVFCFWCTLHSMDGIRRSECPLCRRACSHFPKICGMLHFLLMKFMPEEYLRRAQETHEYETREEMFSPHILPLLRTHCKHDHPLPTKSSKLPDNCATELSASASEGLKGLQSQSTSSYTGKDVISMQQNSRCEDQTCKYSSVSEELSQHPDKCAPQVSSSASGSLESPQSPLALSERGHEEIPQHSFCGDQMCIELSAVDFSCTKCKRFLYKPVVLHCGEVFCQGCVAKSGSIISCPSCGGAHPGGSVNVCLDLQHYLECAFPESVLERKADASQYLAECTVKETSNSQATEETQAVHFGVGCDGCGMHPILGERYKCEDCPEKAGYDLCGDCYEKSTNWVGRFNQQHTVNHHMQRISVEPVSLHVLASYYAVILASEDSSEHSAEGDDDADVPESAI